MCYKKGNWRKKFTYMYVSLIKLHVPTLVSIKVYKVHRCMYAQYMNKGEVGVYTLYIKTYIRILYIHT